MHSPIGLPSVRVDGRPGSTALSMNGIKLSLETSSTRCSRIRPKPLGCLTSTAIATIALVSVCRPNHPRPHPGTPRRPRRDRPAARGPVAPSPTGSDAASPTPSGRTPAPATAGSQRGHAVLLAGHLPRRREPQPQRRASAVEDRPRRDRHLTPANRALPTTAAQPPPSPADAPRTTEPVRPTQPLEVVPTGSLVRKPRQQLRVGARVILARLRHSASLPELDRYPPATKGALWRDGGEWWIDRIAAADRTRPLCRITARHRAGSNTPRGLAIYPRLNSTRGPAGWPFIPRPSGHLVRFPQRRLTWTLRADVPGPDLLGV